MDSQQLIGKVRKSETELEGGPKKKARFTEPANKEKEELKWSYHVNKRINLKIVTREEDIENPSKIFHPEFAHVFFGDDEQISGYNEPDISLYFNAWSFKCYLHFQYQKKHLVLPAPDPIALIKPYLAPDSWTDSLDTFRKNISEDRIAYKPFGELVSTYTITNRNDPNITKEYSIRFHKFGSCDSSFDEDFLKFHQFVQFFVLLEIDGGTYIEARDPRWEVFLLYEKETINNEDYHHLIGYSTAYRFYAFPDRFRLRISQFLLFPPYQKCGHGRRLLQGIYDNAISRGVRDIPVEDPAPEFGRLRDMVDMVNLLQDNAFDKNQKELSKTTLKQIIEKRRLWKGQVRRCFEIFRLAHVDVGHAESYKEYRVYVKRRLIAQNREHLELFEKGEERKAELHRMYEVLEAEYFQIIDKLRQQLGNEIPIKTTQN